MSGNGALASLLGSARIAVRVRAVLLGVKHSQMNALWEGRGKPNVGEEVRKGREMA